jgi:hypothetical protein
MIRIVVSGMVRTESIPDSFAFVDLQSVRVDDVYKFVEHAKGL